MPFIMKSRGLSRAIGMSQLLDTSPDIKVRAGWAGRRAVLCSGCGTCLVAWRAAAASSWRRACSSAAIANVAAGGWAAQAQAPRGAAHAKLHASAPPPVSGHPVPQAIIDRGELVPDHMVLDALLEVVLNPEVRWRRHRAASVHCSVCVCVCAPRATSRHRVTGLLQEKLGRCAWMGTGMPRAAPAALPTHPINAPTHARRLPCAQTNDGAGLVIDGFPRTALQVGGRRGRVQPRRARAAAAEAAPCRAGPAAATGTGRSSAARF